MNAGFPIRSHKVPGHEVSTDQRRRVYRNDRHTGQRPVLRSPPPGGNKSPNTIKAYLDAVNRFDGLLGARGMPRTVAAIRPEHVEAQTDRARP